jgi:hypothetical protein
MLMDIYEKLLEKSDKLKMLSLIIKMTGKRMVKWILKIKIKLAYLNFKQFNQSVMKYFIIRVSKELKKII